MSKRSQDIIWGKNNSKIIKVILAGYTRLRRVNDEDDIKQAVAASLENRPTEWVEKWPTMSLSWRDTLKEL